MPMFMPMPFPSTPNQPMMPMFMPMPVPPSVSNQPMLQMQHDMYQMMMLNYAYNMGRMYQQTMPVAQAVDNNEAPRCPPRS